MKKIIWLVLFFFITPLVNAFEITEIHPNLNNEPSESTSFIEIKTNNSLTNLNLQINEKNFTLINIRNESTNFSLIVSEGFNHENLKCSIYLAKDGIDNKLNETNGSIFLYKNENLITSVDYKNAEKNKSLIEPWNTSAKKAPCIINPAIEDTTINQTKDKSCIIEFNTKTDKKIHDYGDTVKINHIIKNHSNEFEISYWIEDLYGNLVKSNLTTTNTNQKRWTANAKGEAFLIKSILNTNCGETEEKKEITKFSTKPIILRKKEEEEKKDSDIQINDIDENIEFGKTFDIDLQITKGDTRKYSINAHVEGQTRVSEITNIHARGTNKEYRAKVPIAIRNNCNENYEEGNHTLVIEGLGIKKEKEIYIEDNNEGCVEIKSEEKEEQLDTKLKINNIDENIEFGKTFDIDLQIIKGDTRKYSINAHVEGQTRVSEITNIHARGTNKEYRAKVPIAIRNNCNENYEEGKHTLVIEGLGIKKEKEIYIEDNNEGCSEKIIEKEKEIMIEPAPKPEIRSFYTLHRTYNEKINLYATFENINKTKDVKFTSVFENKTIQIKNNSRVTIPAKASKEKNLYVLDIIGHDTKYIQVDFSENDNNQRLKNYTKNNETKEENKSKNDTKKLNELNESNEIYNVKSSRESNLGNKEESKDGLYLSSGERSKSTAKYFFMAILAISIPYAIIKHRRKLYKTPLFLKAKWLNKK